MAAEQNDTKKASDTENSDKNPASQAEFSYQDFLATQSDWRITCSSCEEAEAERSWHLTKATQKWDNVLSLFYLSDLPKLVTKSRHVHFDEFFRLYDPRSPTSFEIVRHQTPQNQVCLQQKRKTILSLPCKFSGLPLRGVFFNLSVVYTVNVALTTNIFFDVPQELRALGMAPRLNTNLPLTGNRPLLFSYTYNGELTFIKSGSPKDRPLFTKSFSMERLGRRDVDRILQDNSYLILKNYQLMTRGLSPQEISSVEWDRGLRHNNHWIEIDANKIKIVTFDFETCDPLEEHDPDSFVKSLAKQEWEDRVVREWTKNIKG